MIYTTLNKIRQHGPCSNGWTKLLRHLGKTQADDEPLALATILDGARPHPARPRNAGRSSGAAPVWRTRPRRGASLADAHPQRADTPLRPPLRPTLRPTLRPAHAARVAAWDAQTTEFRRVFCGDNQ